MTAIEALNPSGLLLARLLVGGFLWISAVTKRMDQDTFLAGLYQYRIVPAGLTFYLAMLIPYLELVLAIWLVVGFQVPMAAMITALVLAGFTFILVSSWVAGGNSSCYCLDALSASHHVTLPVLRNGFLIVLCAVVLSAGGGPYSLDGLLQKDTLYPEHAVQEVLICFLIAAAFVTLIIALEQLFVKFHDYDLEGMATRE